jgi:hypothetical protein
MASQDLNGLTAERALIESQPFIKGLDELAAAVWVQSYDAAWLGQDWKQLKHCLAPDVAFVSHGFVAAAVGRTAVLTNIRELMRATEVHEYNTTDLTAHSSGPVGVISYRWQLDSTVAGERCAVSGRDVLVLRAVKNTWLLVWRAQLRA